MVKMMNEAQRKAIMDKARENVAKKDEAFIENVLHGPLRDWTPKRLRRPAVEPEDPRQERRDLDRRVAVHIAKAIAEARDEDRIFWKEVLAEVIADTRIEMGEQLASEIRGLYRETDRLASTVRDLRKVIEEIEGKSGGEKSSSDTNITPLPRRPGIAR